MSVALNIEYNKLAHVLSAFSLLANPVIHHFFGHNFRALDFLQMFHLSGNLTASGSFSSNLSTAFLDFNQTFFPNCTPGDFVCTNGFRLSFGVVLIGVLLVTFLFVKLLKCCNRTIDYAPIYNFLKGFIKWIYLPLIYHSTSSVIAEANKITTDINKLILPAFILAGTIAHPFIQFIGYKCI